MKTRNILPLALLLMLTLQHCDKNDPKPLTELQKLPQATQSGKRILGCLVDGKAWVVKNPEAVGGFYQTGSLSVSAGLSNNSFSGNMSFYIYDIDLKEQIYLLSEEVAFGKSGRYYDHKISCEFLTTATHTGIVTITNLDKVNYIISGTFEFELYGADCDKVIKITQGRFDIQYAP